MTTKYKIVIEGLTNHFLPQEEIKYQKRYLFWVLFKSHDYKIGKFICCVNEIFEYLKHFTSLGKYQGLAEDKIIELINFALLSKWKNQLPVQGFDLEANDLNKLVEFCGQIDMAGEIFHDKGDGSHPN